jgi:PII-like signaling protein
MLLPGPAQRVVIYLNEDAASEGDYLHLEIVSFLFAQGVSGATVLRGHSGFGAHHRIHTHGAPGVSGEHLPIRVEFIESVDAVEDLMPKLIKLVTDGLIEVQATNIVHIAQPAQSHEQEDRSG